MGLVSGPVSALSLLLLLLCTPSPNVNAAPDGEAQHGAGLRFDKLAAVGDWYKSTSKSVVLTVQNGDVNGSNICTGNFVEINLRVNRNAYNSNVKDDNYSYGSVRVSYTKGAYRPCTDQEVSTSSYGIYSTDTTCCSDAVTLSGEESIAKAGSWQFDLSKQDLITSALNINIPLQENASTTTSNSGGGGGGAGEPATGTAVVTLNVDCVDVISRHSTTTADSCTRGECVSSSGQQNKYWCTKKLNDAKVTGTVRVRGQGLNQPKIDLAKLPAGYTVAARADFGVETGKAGG
eukprot:TRINITY_DN1162_c1_g1_i2.p1 TRINITY_DN1162_c1_g1~~TRINITY_DN1162_c1_g1_i2.p1  ORF type:complete len:291 (+),score=85.52 TRINITY_DN1162_c1_g1_i2:338-1210(+)